MLKSIELKEGFILEFDEEKNKINIRRLVFNNLIIATNWMEVTDFVAILEAATRNKLGTKKRYQAHEATVYGIMGEDYNVCIDFIGYELIYKFDIVEVMQIISKLNKLLHMADKLKNCHKVFDSY